MRNETPAWFAVDPEAMRRDLYIGTFEPTPRTQLDELAAEYHERCETYDRRVCTGPIVRGSIAPANPRELRLINRHAIAVLRELRSRAELHGFSPIQLFKAIHNHA
jgi:hypothetical protein